MTRQRSRATSAVMRSPIIPDRIRNIGGQSFAFIHHRFLRDGFFVSLTPNELRLYLLFVLAGDRNGVSFYHYDSICSILEIYPDDYVVARNALIEKDLIAFDGTRTQVLSLPERPVPRHSSPLTTQDDFERRDPATIRIALRDALGRDDKDD